MTPEEFETKLNDLMHNAPKGTTIFMTCPNDESRRPTIHCIQGKAIDVISDVALFVTKVPTAKEMVQAALDAAKFATKLNS